uniref:DUF418 domain-containing protein n=1 Tax=Solibacter usitatus (strain Ellin6076) TaxID=234267 RepID=Q01SV0_SOLUE
MIFQPVGETGRYRYLDVLRGIALFGVLLVNLLTGFRMSMFQHFAQAHSHPGRVNWLVDTLVATFVEFKALTLFTFLFGVGIAIQAERSAARGVPVTPFLLRRFLVLMAFGLAHMFLIWNGDILLLYAVCGLLIVPSLRLPPRVLALLGFAAILLPSFVSLNFHFLSEAAMRAHVEAANRVYAHGDFLEILRFRSSEAVRLVLPLLWGVLPRTAGLMWWGVAAWRSGLLRKPEDHRGALATLLIAGVALGGVASFLHSRFEDLFVIIPLASAYAGAVLLWYHSGGGRAFAAAGQMALTNYLAQSVVLGCIFYGYGFGLFGRLDPTAGLGLAIALYVIQLAASLLWLRRYRFGPAEWLWRSLTYGRIFPLRRGE